MVLHILRSLHTPLLHLQGASTNAITSAFGNLTITSATEQIQNITAELSSLKESRVDGVQKELNALAEERREGAIALEREIR